MTPTQRKEDLTLLEKIAPHESAIPWYEDEILIPGSSLALHMARLLEQGYIAHRNPNTHSDLRSSTEGGLSHYVLTQSGNEYLAMLSSAPTAIPTTTAKRVFITHGKNRSYLRDAEDACRAAGFEPEVAIFSPNMGQTVMEKVASGIDRADVVLVILTDDDGTGKPSLNAAGELHVAMFQNKHVILFRERNAEIPTNLENLAHNYLEGQWTLVLVNELNAYKNQPKGT